jgi:hypothetical protein
MATIILVGIGILILLVSPLHHSAKLSKVVESKLSHWKSGEGTKTAEWDKPIVIEKVIEKSTIAKKVQINEPIPAKDLLWESNESGFYSHFFEIKYLTIFAERYNVNIWMKPIYSPHYDEPLIMCEYLQLSRIFCLNETVAKTFHRKCIFEGFQTLIPRILAGEEYLCFAGYVFHRQGLNNIRYSVHILGPRLNFQPDYEQLYLSIKQHIGLDQHQQLNHSFSNNDALNLSQYHITKINETNQIIYHHSIRQRLVHLNHTLYDYYTVTIHWRRGDQLSTRCKSNFIGLHDHSVNCENVNQFLEQIDFDARQLLLKLQQSTPQQQQQQQQNPMKKICLLLFIATNENSKKTLNKIRSIQNNNNIHQSNNNNNNTNNQSFNHTQEPLFYQLILLSDLYTNHFPFYHHHYAHRLVSVNHTIPHHILPFILDSLFMLHSDYLWNYGISQIHDVIECERMFRNQSYCSLNPLNEDSWCSLYNFTIHFQSKTQNNKYHSERKGFISNNYYQSPIVLYHNKYYIEREIVFGNKTK